MPAVVQAILAGFASASPLDQLNLALGLAGVWLMIRRSLWAFPVGLAAVSVQAVLFYRARFYADAVLQGFFFGTLAWGWWHWVRRRSETGDLAVTILGSRARLGVAAAALTATAAWALVLRQWTDAVMPWRDAFIAAFSVAAQILQARRHLENWALWTLVNVVAIAAYWHAGLAFTAFLYVVYLGLGLTGWRTWHLARAAAQP